ncbi:transglutaminase domain-containing protein [Laribacter hongkongensis]|uniref:transglutaminase domain-containing protein n=1 Tax=Laribacter hongkongensis TaxID=168471 RepID=UPI0027E5079D|nr:transglutaminase domain-containing protein [Laribacter hongkongensis]
MPPLRAAAAFAAGAGVCQDHAQVYVAACRSLGVPGPLCQRLSLCRRPAGSGQPRLGRSPHRRRLARSGSVQWLPGRRPLPQARRRHGLSGRLPGTRCAHRGRRRAPRQRRMGRTVPPATAAMTTRPRHDLLRCPQP